MKLIMLIFLLLTAGCMHDPTYRRAELKNFSNERLCSSGLQYSGYNTRFISPADWLEDLDKEIFSRGINCRDIYKAMSNKMLCDTSAIAISLPPSERRAALDQELHSRVINCHQHSYNYTRAYNEMQHRLLGEQQAQAIRDALPGLLHSAGRAAETFIIVGGAMGAASTPIPTGRARADDMPLTGGFLCPLRSSSASGMYRNCSYDCAGGLVVQSVNVSTFCPTSIRR